MWFVANGDILMRFPDDMSCFLAVVRVFLAVVRVPFEMSCLLALVPNTVVPKYS